MTKKFLITQGKIHFPEILRAAKRAYRRLTRRRSGIEWGDKLVDLSGFKFDREDANARH